MLGFCTLSLKFYHKLLIFFFFLVFVNVHAAPIRKEENIRRLMIFVFAASIIAECGDAINEFILEGPLCREPTYRRTPLGREICDAMLAVPRAFHRADYLPCILWGRTAQLVAACHTRDLVRILGRLQSRTYTKLTENGPEERIAYEISALGAEILEPC